MNYIRVNTEYFNYGLKPIDALVLAVVESFNSDNKLCYMTNEQLADMFSVTKATVARSIDHLVKYGFITRNTKTIKKDGEFTRRRTLTIVPVQNAQEE